MNPELNLNTRLITKEEELDDKQKKELDRAKGLIKSFVDELRVPMVLKEVISAHNRQLFGQTFQCKEINELLANKRISLAIRNRVEGYKERKLENLYLTLSNAKGWQFK